VAGDTSDCIEISAPSVSDPISAGALLAADVASAAIDDSSGGSAANDEKLGIDTGIDSGEDGPSTLKRLPPDCGGSQQQLLTGENDTNRSSPDDEADVVLQASGHSGRAVDVPDFTQIKVMFVRSIGSICRVRGFAYGNRCRPRLPVRARFFPTFGNPRMLTLRSMRPKRGKTLSSRVGVLAAALACLPTVAWAAPGGSSCTTPWGNRIVASGETIAREPYFTNGNYTFAVANIRYLCSNGVWTLLDGRTPVPGARQK
jgi:hypothetical protein